MSKFLVLPLKLFIITLAAGLLLGLTYSITKNPILEQAVLRAEQSRVKVFPGAEFELLDEAVWINLVPEDEKLSVKEIYKAIKRDVLVGYVITVNSKGYGGDIELIIGIDTHDYIIALEVASHKETAGLGSNLTLLSFREQFRGKHKLVLVKGTAKTEDEISALTGATITSNAVVSGSNFAIDMVKEIEKVQE